MLGSRAVRPVLRAAAPRVCLPCVRTPIRLASAAAPQELDLTVHEGPAAVARAEGVLEMGVLYPPGVPTPLECVNSIQPISVTGTVAKCDGGGGPLGHPVEFIKLNPRLVCRPCFPKLVLANGM